MTVEMKDLDRAVTFGQQLQESTGAVVFVNTFVVTPEDAEDLLAAWTDDAKFMKQQPGFISTQLHRGVGGSRAFVNIAVWESAETLRVAFGHPEFQNRLRNYPASTVATPHLFKKVAVPGICVE